jgi:hypothetical protein
LILCNDCGKPLTACGSRGKPPQIPVLSVQHQRLASYRKSIRREDLETAFEGVLQRLEPSENLFQLVKSMFKDAWAMRVAQTARATKALERFQFPWNLKAAHSLCIVAFSRREVVSTSLENALKANIAQIEKGIEVLLDRIVESGNASVIAAYEKRITKLEREKALAEEMLATNGKPRLTLEESFEHALQFLSSPWNIWVNSGVAGRKTVPAWHFWSPWPTAGIRDFEHQIQPFYSRRQ